VSVVGDVNAEIYTKKGHSRILARDELLKHPTPTTLDAGNNNSKKGEDQAV
jgi:hypothetical protein